MDEVAQVLDFWFGELEDGFADATHRAAWFSGRSQLDKEITHRFASLHDDARRGELGGWLDDPRKTLAFVVVCDQFSRNIHRGSAMAFQTDTLALDASLLAIERRWDLQLGFDERAFLYMPLEHSESLIHQHASVGLFSQLHDGTAPNRRQASGSFLKYAHQHRDIIQRFGRFPHRNAVLGRTTTPEEAKFIAKGNGFGQKR